MKKQIAEFIVPPIIDIASPIVSIGIARPNQISTTIKVLISYQNFNFRDHRRYFIFRLVKNIVPKQILLVVC